MIGKLKLSEPEEEQSNETELPVGGGTLELGLESLIEDEDGANVVSSSSTVTREVLLIIIVRRTSAGSALSFWQSVSGFVIVFDKLSGTLPVLDGVSLSGENVGVGDSFNGDKRPTASVEGAPLMFDELKFESSSVSAGTGDETGLISMSSECCNLIGGLF